MRTIRDCNVAVIGGAGFLGSHLVDHLVEDRNCDVLVVDNLVAGRREFVHPRARFEHHDITGSESRLRQLLQGCRFVFNYTAYPYIPVSFARPIHVNDVNFMGAMKAINAAQEAGCEAILQVSSAEIYGYGAHNKHSIANSEEIVIPRPDGNKSILNISTARIDELELVAPHSSYGVAKAAVDNWIQVRWREAKTPCIALRQFNCVGPRETHPYIVPEIISQLYTQRCSGCGNSVSSDSPPLGVVCSRCSAKRIATVKLGNNSFRDFLYAGDAVRAATLLLERGEFGEVYNLGSETGIKMYDLAKLIGKVMGFSDVVVEQDPARVRPWEIWRLLASNDKIKRLLGDDWPELVPLEEALRRTYAWYVGNGCKWPWEK